MEIKIKLPVTLRINVEGPKGKREIDAILDTGAVYTSVSWDIAKDIGYDPAVSERRKEIITANGVIEVPLIRIDSVSIRELEARNVDTICHNIPEISTVNGLIGLSFLKNFNIQMNFKDGRMRIEDLKIDVALKLG